MANLSVAIAKELGLAEDRITGLRLGATIHDIGKIYVPAEILTRPGQLSHIEFDFIKTHPQVGFDIMKDVRLPWPVAEMILQHHEHLDGSGYPSRLEGGRNPARSPHPDGVGRDRSHDVASAVSCGAWTRGGA